MKLTVIKPQRRQPRPYAGILRRSFKVGVYTVWVTMDLDACEPGTASQLRIEWEPDVPRTLTEADRRFYRKRRNRIVQEIADITGGAIAVADV